MDRLLIAVMGNRNSGKSHTWNKLFGYTVHTGKNLHALKLADDEYVDVFLVSGSPEERQRYVGKILKNKKPRIVLCSVQYKNEARETFDHFLDGGYSAFVQWLNPGRHDESQYPDTLGFLSYLLYSGSAVSIRDGKANAQSRVGELREKIAGWARSRRLIYSRG